MRPKPFATFALVALLASCTSGRPPGPASAPEPGRTHVAEPPGEEPGEGGAGDSDRIERTGVALRTGPIQRDPAPGWAGERLFGNGNDWEPATATDPTAPYVYMVTTRYSGRGPLPCERCDIPTITLKVSSDGGATFGPVQYMPVDVPGGQYDPQIETDGAGNVYAVWINGNFHDVFSKSTDHGQTWSDPVTISAPGGWADHPWLGVSPSGQHVYVGFNHAVSWVAQSHDGGQTWLPAVLTSHVDRYFYANGDVVQDDGSVAISQMSYRLHSHDTGSIKLVVTRSTDGGQTFQTTTIDTVAQQPDCLNEGCPHDHYGAHAALAGDANGNLVLVYDGAVEPKGAQFIWSRRSTDGGATWTDPTRISPGGPTLIATEPAAVATGDCDIHAIYMDDRYGIERWNVWYRRSTDCGITWSPGVRISDATSGTGYKSARGFAADYGDYGEVAVTNTGATFAVWGEGFSYDGPGGTWYNRTL